MPDLPSGNVTFLFTDIEGSTRLWEEKPEAMSEALARHDALLRQTLEAHGGSIFKTIGDAFCAAFPTAFGAVAAALAAQTAVRTEDWAAIEALRVRMALHAGAAEERGGDYFGPTLNRVARLLTAGHGGQILLSQAACDLVRDTLPPETSLRDLGSHRLKDLQQPEHLFQLIHPSLTADFPPLRSLEAFAHNLPLQLTSFIGREREMAEVKRLLSTTRLLTLTGSGGCGKTRLSLQVAAELPEEYPDGVWLVELAALADPALVPQTVAAALGVREEPNRSLLTTLVDFSRSKSLLLLLDNCEHLLSACAQLAESLLKVCPKLRILASSREGLGIAGERTYRLPSLSLPDPLKAPPPESLEQYEAVRLFVERATFAHPTFTVTDQNASAVVQVCHRLDGIPLAIELAAARVKALPVEQIAARLDDRFRLLTGGSRTALPRQQTLRALIDWSHDLLSDAERRLLRRVSVFAGGWTVEAAEAVCSGQDVEAWEILDLLTHLVDKSLVIYDDQGGEARYGLLETVRQYGRERLIESGEAEAVRERHLEWYLGLAERAEPELKGRDQARWLQRLDADRGNLRLALAWGLETAGQSRDEQEAPASLAQAGSTLQLAAALGRYWELRSSCAEGQEVLERALEREKEAPTKVLARALTWAGFFAGHQVDFLDGITRMEESLNLSRELGDRQGMAQALIHLGIVALRQGDQEAARRWSEECLAISRQIGDRWSTAHALSNLATVAAGQGKGETARPLFEESLAIQREIGDKRGAAWSLGGLGWAGELRGDYEAGQEFYEESLALHREIGNRPGVAGMLTALGRVPLRHGQYEAAHALLQEALAVAREDGDKRSIYRGLNPLAWLTYVQGDDGVARALCQEALGIAREMGWPGLIPLPLHLLGCLALHRSDLTTAQTLFDEALAIARARMNEDGFAWALQGFARLALARGQVEQAARLFAATDAYRRSDVFVWGSLERVDCDRSITAARSALGEEAFATAWTEGQAMSPQQAIEYAIEERTKEGQR